MSKSNSRSAGYSSLRTMLEPLGGKAANFTDGPKSIFAKMTAITPKSVLAKIEAEFTSVSNDPTTAGNARAEFPEMLGVKKYLTDLCVEIAIRQKSKFYQAFGFNTFKRRVEWVQPVLGREIGQEWSAQDDMQLLLFVQELGINANRRHVEAVVDYLARQNPIDPVVTYLNGLVWDRIERLDKWLPQYFNGADTPYSSFIGPKYLISAVARQFDPGCQVDHMLILEGQQGLGKTRGLETLFGSDWVNDNMPKIGTRSSAMAISGFMLVNIDELGAFAGERLRVLKSFLTMTEDKYDPKYENRIVTAPRRCVFSGTTNESYYLFDEENRRFWPYECVSVDRDGLKKNRDQLWAEAVHRYKQGESWWPTTNDQTEMIRAEQAKRKPSDPLIDELHEIVWFKPEWRVKDIMAKLEISKKDRNLYHDAVIGRKLPEFEFKKQRKHRGGDVWVRPYPIPEQFQIRITQSVFEQLERVPLDQDTVHSRLMVDLLSDPEIKAIYDNNVHLMGKDQTRSQTIEDIQIDEVLIKTDGSLDEAEYLTILREV